MPGGLAALTNLDLGVNQLTNITLPPDMQQLMGIFTVGNPLTTFVLSESLAATNLAAAVAALRNQRVSAITYPLAIQLISPHRTVAGAFELRVAGPPAIYTILGSTNLVSWNALATVTNQLGEVGFTDEDARFSPQKFYRAQLP